MNQATLDVGLQRLPPWYDVHAPGLHRSTFPSDSRDG